MRAASDDACLLPFHPTRNHVHILLVIAEKGIVAAKPHITPASTLAVTGEILAISPEKLPGSICFCFFAQALTRT